MYDCNWSGESQSVHGGADLYLIYDENESEIESLSMFLKWGCCFAWNALSHCPRCFIVSFSSSSKEL